jgi:hypothetical protein
MSGGVFSRLDGMREERLVGVQHQMNGLGFEKHVFMNLF